MNKYKKIGSLIGFTILAGSTIATIPFVSTGCGNNTDFVTYQQLKKNDKIKSIIFGDNTNISGAEGGINCKSSGNNCATKLVETTIGGNNYRCIRLDFITNDSVTQYEIWNSTDKWCPSDDGRPDIFVWTLTSLTLFFPLNSFTIDSKSPSWGDSQTPLQIAQYYLY